MRSSSRELEVGVTVANYCVFCQISLFFIQAFNDPLSNVEYMLCPFPFLSTERALWKISNEIEFFFLSNYSLLYLHWIKVREKILEIHAVLRYVWAKSYDNHFLVKHCFALCVGKYIWVHYEHPNDVKRWGGGIFLEKRELWAKEVCQRKISF